MKIVSNGKSEDVLSKEKISYSADEQLIGTWIDGKPLYRRVIIGTFGALNVYKVVYTFPENVSICQMNSIAQNTSNGFVPLFFFNGDITNPTRTWTYYLNRQIVVYTNDSRYADQHVHCIVEYTKNSD